MKGGESGDKISLMLLCRRCEDHTKACQYVDWPSNSAMCKLWANGTFLLMHILPSNTDQNCVFTNTNKYYLFGSVFGLRGPSVRTLICSLFELRAVRSIFVKSSSILFSGK